MGWLWLALFGVGAMGALAALGVARGLWSFVGAALMLGAAGYAWQGSPTLPGRSPDPRATLAPDDPSLIALRDDMVGRFTLIHSRFLTGNPQLHRTAEATLQMTLLLLSGLLIQWEAFVVPPEQGLGLNVF